jgi:hypothetical protein
MLRSMMFAVSFAVIFAASHPVHSDAPESTASDHAAVVQGEQPVMARLSPVIPAVWRLPDDAPANVAHDKRIALVGFGCG